MLVGVSDALPRQLVVRCPITIPRTIEIVTPAGEPVAGSRIELWRPGGDEFVEWGAEALQWGWPRGSSAVPMLRLLHAVTDGDGRAQIVAVPHERHELRVRGPEHRPLVRAVSFGSEDDPLRIVVSTGATVEGRFAPPEFVERVAALGGSDMPPMVELVHDTGQAFEPHPQQPVAIAADGSFRIERVPPGSWQVVVVAWIGTTTRWRARLPVGAPIALGDGDHRELHLDASRSMPCTLRGLVLVNAEPWREQGITVQLEHDLPMLRHGAGPNGFRATTDADGVFTLTRLPAVYRVRVGDMEAPESCRVGPGSTTHATFTIVRGTVALRCVDENGCSVEGAFALVTGPGDAQREVRAGVDGRAVVPLPPGPIAVGVLPAALRDAASQEAFWREHGDDERVLRRVAVGAVHGIVEAGRELPLRIVVPSTAGYQGTER